MQLVKGDSLFVSAGMEIMSAAWMEVAMFAVAAVIYAFCTGGVRHSAIGAVLKRRGVCFFPLPCRADKMAHASKDSQDSTAIADKGETNRAAGLAGPRERSDARASKPSAGGTSAQKLAAAIKACARDRDMEGAQTVFNRISAGGAQLNTLLCNTFLDACVQCGDLDKAASHFEEMRRHGLVDVVAYNTLLKMHLTHGQAREAHAVVQEMQAKGLQANRVTYCELINAKVTAKDNAGIWRLVDEMMKVGLKPNSVLCSILLKSLSVHSSTSDIKRVIGFIDEMEDMVDEVLLSSTIEACIRLHQLDLLSELMVRCRQKICCVRLSAPTYGSMIKAYGQAGDIIRVRALWQEMADRDVKPTSITLGCMVEALVVNTKPEEAWDLVHKQLHSEELRGCVNTVIYSTVLKGFAGAHRIDRAFAVYTEMRDKRIPCNTITYNTLLDACAKTCSMRRAAELLEDMKATSVEPDIITYSTIIKGYCVEGDLDRAFGVLDEMKSGDDEFAPDEIMYNSLLDGCAKQHRVEDALRVLEEMKASGVGPSNYTLSILVKLLGHARRLNQAFSMVEDLSKQHGFRPNVQVYTCLMQACILNRKLERAVQLHNTVVSDSSCTADQKLYTALVRGCLQLHKPLRAVEVVRAAFQLSGHNLKEPTRKPVRPVGVEVHVLTELFTRLKSGTPAEQEALSELEADLESIGVSAKPCGKGRSRGLEARRRVGGGGGGGRGR